MTGWQPIETAPKDGKAIIAWPVYSEPHSVATVRWETMKRIPGRWSVAGGSWPAPRTPTHWMPLPEPPTSAD
jgi:hypothetical protein